MKPKGTIRVALIDIGRVYKEGLKSLLRKSSKIEVIGEACSDQNLLKFILQKKPQILLFDIPEPTMALPIIETIAKVHPYIKLLILSNNSDETFVARIISAGAHGFVIKDLDDKKIIEVIKKIHVGKTYYSIDSLEQMKELFVKKAVVELNGSTPSFTKKEEEIIKCICSEMTSKETAEKLFLSVRTIEGYRTKILQKIKAKGTAGIVIHAIKRGLLNDGQ